MTAPWVYRDPLEAKLTAEVSPATLMQHVRTIGGWSASRAARARRRRSTTSSARSSPTASRSSGGRSRPTSACRRRARLTLPDGSVIEGLTHSFSTSVEALEARSWTSVTGGRTISRRGAAGKIALVRRAALPGPRVGRPAGGHARADLRPHGPPAQHDRDDGLGHAGARDGVADPGDARACRSSASTASGCGRGWRAGRSALRMTTRVRTGWMPIPHLVGELAGRQEDRFLLFSGHVDSWHYGAMDNGTANATMLEVARLLAARRERAPARHPLRVLVGPLARPLRRLGLVRGSRLARAAPALRPASQRGFDRRARRHRLLGAARHRGRAALRRGGRRRRDRPAQPRAALLARRRSVLLGRRRALGVHVALGAAEAGHRSVARDGTAGRQRGFPVVVAHQGRHDRQDRPRRAGAGHQGLPRLRAALAERAGAAARPRARRAGAARPSWRRCRPPPARASTSRPALEAARALGERLERVAAGARRRSTRHAAARREAINRGLMRLSRVLVPLAYTSGDRFTHDLAVPIPPLAGLQRARELARARSRHRRVQVRAGGARARAQPCGARPRLGGLGGRRAAYRRANPSTSHKGATHAQLSPHAC